MAKRTAANYLVDTLIAAGIKRIYGICGDSLNSVTQAMLETKKLDWVHVRHEEVGAFAAGSEAHLTQELTVCAGSCGPGNLHLINGLYDCHKSRVPVLALAAQIPSIELGSNYFQETHPEQIFAGCSHFCEVVSQAEQLPRLLKLAMETAVAKRGVSVLILPADVGLKAFEHAVQAISIEPNGSTLMPTPQKITEMAALLNAGQKVTILAGAGCANARPELLAIADRLKAPIVHALRGKEFLEYENPFDVGMTGLLGFSSGYKAMESCDLLLMLGTDFPYTQFYPDAKTIQVDHLAENIGRRTKVDLGLAGDVKQTLTSVLPQLAQKQDARHLEHHLAEYVKAREKLDELAAEPAADAKDQQVHPQLVARLLSELASDDAVFTCDVGTPSIWAARYLKMNGRRRLLGSFCHGSMANALPQAIGAQAAFPGRQCISMSGDGGFSMLMGDFLTLNQMGLPVKTIIFNNGALSFVEIEMMASGLEPTQTDLKNPNFAKMAEAVGVRGFRVERACDLRAALAEALNAPGPALVDIIVSPVELSMPPHISLEQVRGFGLFALKAVISGRGRELVDLAHTNFWSRLPL